MDTSTHVGIPIFSAASFVISEVFSTAFSIFLMAVIVVVSSSAGSAVGGMMFLLVFSYIDIDLYIVWELGVICQVYIIVSNEECVTLHGQSCHFKTIKILKSEI